MKKALFIFFALISITTQGQVANGTETKQNAFRSLSPQTATTVNYLTTMGTDGTMGRVTPVNVTIPTVPLNYTVLTPTLGAHLSGIDTRLGQISSTTAGLTQRIYFTADDTTVNSVVYFASNSTGKGSTAAGSPPALVLADNTKGYFTKDLISIPQPAATIGYAGSYSGNLTVSATPTPVATRQRFTVEVYRTNNLGTPIASGVSGAPVGDLGVTVVAVLDSGELNINAGSITNVAVNGILTQNITINTGERLRYHVSAAKIGVGGGNVTFQVYYGSSYNSYYDVPVAIRTNAVLNDSGVTGVTATDALNNLKTADQAVAGAGVTYGHITDGAQTLAGDKTLTGQLTVGTPYNTNTYTDKIIIYGNSIETGASASPKSVYGWNVVVPQILETKVDNYAISGTTLVKFFNGDNSGIDRLSSITPTYVSTMRAYISGIGVNDMYNVNGAYNETNFRNAYYQLIDQLVTNGWPLSKIFIFLPLTTNANTTTMNATISSIASIKGVNFIDVKGYMDANGGTSLLNVDGIHPNNLGHKIISDIISSTIPGTKYKYTQINQDLSVTGVITTGIGLSGGSGSNGLEIRGTNDVNNSGKISMFGDIYFNKNIISNNSGAVITPNRIHMGSEFVTGALTGSNLQFYTYNQTGIGTSSTDGLGLYSIAGTSGRITSYQEHYFKNNIILANTPGAVTTPLKFIGGQSFINGAITTSNTTFSGYGGSGMGFSATEGISLIAGNGLVPFINLKNPTTITGTITSTGSATFGNSLSGAQATPSFVDLGGSFSNSTVTGSSLKLKLYSNTGLGVDATNGLVLLSTAGTGNRITSLSGHAFSSSIYITNAPTTSAGTYDILTRNTSTGDVEKVASSAFAATASPTFTGTPTAPTATAGTNTTQIATTAFVQAATRPYKSYTATISQSGTSDPTVNIFENTLSGAIVWTRNSAGSYTGTLSGAFTDLKTVFFNSNNGGSNTTPMYFKLTRTSSDTVLLNSSVGTTFTDAILSSLTIEIRVYN